MSLDETKGEHMKRDPLLKFVHLPEETLDTLYIYIYILIFEYNDYLLLPQEKERASSLIKVRLLTSSSLKDRG